METELELRLKGYENILSTATPNGRYTHEVGKNRQIIIGILTLKRFDLWNEGVEQDIKDLIRKLYKTG